MAATTETTNNVRIDWNSIIAQVIVKHEQAFFQSLSGAFKQRYTKARINFGNAFSIYLNNALEKYSKVKTLLYRNAPRPLYEFYEFNDIESDDGQVIDCENIQSVLEESQFSIILGDGGSGKTMLMRHFFLNALQDSNFIPIFVELRKLDDTTSIFDYIYRCLNTLGFDLEKDYFKYALEQGMFVILLDGYDELRSTSKETFLPRLEEFCDMYYKNNFIISSRKSGSFISWQRFSVYHIMPLTKERALDLVKKLDYDVEIKDKFYKKLDNELFASHFSFASNPLLLSIMLMTFDQYADIPEKLHVFYAFAFDTLYSMHDATKGGYRRELKSKLTCDQFKDIFSRFCFKTYMHGLFQFSSDKILSYIGEAGSHIPGFDKDAYFEDLQVAVCLLCEEGREYQFTHRSFQEYFAACYLNSLDDDKQAKACRLVLKISGKSLSADKVLDMLRDMGEDRFSKNYIVPMLQEIKGFCPVISDTIQQYLYGLVEYCFISAIPENIFAEECNLIYPISGPHYMFEKGSAFLGVKFFNSEYALFTSLVYSYYRDPSEKCPKSKLDTVYWERRYTPEDIWLDTTLRQHIVQYTLLGKHLKLLSSLLDPMQQRQDELNDEFQKMLDEILA